MINRTITLKIYVNREPYYQLDALWRITYMRLTVDMYGEPEGQAMPYD